jgi:NAD dependent epimerase/dehydratase family enzyme
VQNIVAVKKPGALILPAPPFAIKLALGEMSGMLLGSQRCSAERILMAGYKFKYREITGALKNIYQDA